MIGEMTTTGVRKHLLTVSVEDYFQSGALNGVIARKHWTRIESRLEKSIQAVISLLEEHQVKATFFVLGWIADRQPEIVRLIRAAGHEIGSRGYWKGMPSSPQQLREELQRGRTASSAIGTPNGSRVRKACGSSTSLPARDTTILPAWLPSGGASRPIRAGPKRGSTIPPPEEHPSGNSPCRP
jgi:hypothetical protein